MATKRKSAYVEGILETQRRLALEAKLQEQEQDKASKSISENSTQEEPKKDEGNHNLTQSTPPTQSKAKKHNEKKGNLIKVSCYLRPEQVSLWDDLTDELRTRVKKKKLEYKDIDRQVILREIFDTINQEQIEQLLTAKRSNSRTP